MAAEGAAVVAEPKSLLFCHIHQCLVQFSVSPVPTAGPSHVSGHASLSLSTLHSCEFFKKKVFTCLLTCNLKQH